MPVTIRDILNLDILRDTTVIAGNSGLDRFVNRIATIEKPFSDHFEYSWNVAQKGDLYMSKLFVFRDSRDKLYDEIEFMVASGAGGLVINRGSEPMIDLEMRRLADENDLPIIVVNDACGFAELTYSITGLIVKDRMAGMNENYVEHVLRANLGKNEIKNTLLRINPHFKDAVLSLYLLTEHRVNTSAYSLCESDMSLAFHDGLLFLLTGSGADAERIRARGRMLVDAIKTTVSGYRVGVGSLRTGLGEAKETLLEAIYAAAYCEMFGLRISRFSDLGTYKLLVKLRQDKDLSLYRDEMFGPITSYERENNIELLPVLRLFIRFGGNYKAIAGELFIHETTARYRMNKIYEILGVGDRLGFHSSAAAASLADHILTNRTLQNL